MVVSREQQLEKEVTELKLKIAHLEHGVGVIEAADAYAARQKQYAEQVERLAAGLTEARRQLDDFRKTLMSRSPSEALNEPFVGIEVPGKK